MPGGYRMYGDSSLVVIGESSFKIDLYFIHYDLQTLYTSKRILIKKIPLMKHFLFLSFITISCVIMCDCDRLIVTKQG